MNSLEEEVKGKAEQVSSLLKNLQSSGTGGDCRGVVADGAEPQEENQATVPPCEERASWRGDFDKSWQVTVPSCEEKASWRNDFDKGWGNAFLKA
jgi:hypothetical protein